MDIPSRKEVSSRILSVIFYRIYLFRKSHFMVTFVQIIMPALILFMFATIHSAIFTDKQSFPNGTTYNETTENDLYKSICDPRCETPNKTIIAYKFDSWLPKNFVEILLDSLKNHSSSFKLVQVSSEEDMIKLSILCHLLSADVNYVGGIVIHTNETCNRQNRVSSSPCLNFKIRMAKNIPSEISSSDFNNLDDSKVKAYFPLMGLQLAISRAFIKSKLNTNFTKLNINIQPFPYPPHVKFFSPLPSTSNRLFLSISFVLGMTFIVYSAIRAPCSDKQSGFKVYLQLMGLPSWAFWLTWILNDVFIQFIAVALQVLLLFLGFNNDLGVVVKHGSPVIWTVFLLFYAMASISFCTFLASYFRRGILATYICATIWLLSYYFAELYLPSYIVSFSRYSKLGVCLIPNAALLWGITLMISNAGGINSENISHRLESEGISLTEVLIMLAVDIVFYFILTLYTDMLRPGKGPAKPWYFIFKPNCSWWKRRRRSSSLDEVLADDEDISNFVGKREAAIKCDNLTRHFYQQSKAIDGITMRLKREKCTAIVGHNGSGKSSLLYLLCGGLSPTKGDAIVLGYSIKTQMSIIQSFTSVCCETNYLCEDMTVLEHLLLVARLKGLSHSKAMKDARAYLKQLDLNQKSNRYPNYLLEFERRKLSLIMAMIGKSQVILIDEPTKGVEEDMRKSMWEFIQNFRGKTILVATSSLDEAYALGNRVAILAHGKVVALGTPQHLENLLVTGYHLKIRVKKNANQDNITSYIRSLVLTSDYVEPESRRMIKAMSIVDKDFDTPSITGIVNNSESNVPEDTAIDMENEPTLSMTELMITDEKPEIEDLSIQLPKAEVSKFSDLFMLLENPNVLAHLDIFDWSLSLYAIDSAFKDAKLYLEWADVSHRRPSGNSALISNSAGTERLTPMLMAFFRFTALVIKRFLWIYGTWLYVFVQFLSPIILLIITIQGTNSIFSTRLERSEIGHSLLDHFPRPVILFKEVGNPEFLREYRSLEELRFFEEIHDTFADRISAIPSDPEARLSGTFVVGAEINNNNVSAMFSPTAFHGGPISLLMVLNAYIANLSLGYKIMSSSHPIEFETKELLKFYIPSDPNETETDEVLTFAIMLSFGLFIFTSGFVLQPLSERTCGLRNLQLNTTLSKVSYWLSFLLCDMILHMILTGMIVVILVYLPDHNAFRDFRFTQHFVGIYLLAGYGSIMQAYVASFIFRHEKTCFYAMLSCNQVMGIFTFILGKCISGIPGSIFQIVLKICFPPYSVSSGFFSLMMMTLTRENTQCNLLCKTLKEVLCRNNIFGVGNDSLQFDTNILNKTCCESDCHKAGGHCDIIGEYYTLESLKTLSQGLSSDVLFLSLHSVIMTVLLILIELRIAQRFFKTSSNTNDVSLALSTDQNTDICETVQMEREKLKKIKQLRTDERSKFFVIDSISVDFHSRPALTNVLLVAEPGEILAIVGPHGSGKTVLMKVLTRFLGAKEGNAYYKGKALFYDTSSKFIKRIGYCPSEINKINSKMSGLQLMRLFGRLRGIPEAKLKSHVSRWLKLLGLTERASFQKFGFYTDSIKRKLFLALALIGDPPVLLLDDPMKNLDPLSKLEFWAVMHSITKDRDRIVIFTTRRTDDLAKNVRRMAILVNGCIKRIMSPADMMEKFGQGFTISVQLKQNPVKAGFDDYIKLKSSIEKDLHGVVVHEEQYTLKYQVPKEEYKWSELFRIAEEIKLASENIVEEYSIRETELEDVYRTLASKQQHFVRAETTWDEFCIQYC